MKANSKYVSKIHINKVKVKPEKPLPNLLRDPTLEGRDENRVGRIPEKSTAVDQGTL